MIKKCSSHYFNITTLLYHPVSYFSKKFLQYQKKKLVMEKETLGLVSALDNFDVCLGSAPFKIKVHTDHNPLSFLKTKKNRKQRQPFKIHI